MEPADVVNSEPGCSQWGPSCGPTHDGQMFCGDHGECYAEDASGSSTKTAGGRQFTAKCVCEPGWGGARCNRQLEYVEFTPDGYVQYELLPSVFSEFETRVDLLVVPGAATAAAPLAYAQSHGKVSAVDLEVGDGWRETMGLPVCSDKPKSG